ncbi:histidine phosphatase family protein [Undibacterium griseum]|uniref:Histidine phosphatase family protein n=1 Tax=Undibacterium griseum TaxID=2762295 RepID=A0ABR6YRS5_9BURK|nr:histidine phosphatase family protein [Undibacterium griseum]MBC3886595.1 histidine phosphatase family protein [Undibacterium griseum]
MRSPPDNVAVRLHLIRHTAPQIDSDVCYGQADIAVSHTDCIRLAASMYPRWQGRIPVYSSPLQRCHQLAVLLHERPVTDARLMEMSFGEWELRSWSAIPRVDVEAWAQNVAHYCPGGGESLLQMVGRVDSFLRELLRTAQQTGQDEAVLVCHGGVIRVILAWNAALSHTELAQLVSTRQVTLDFGSCHEISLTANALI